MKPSIDTALEDQSDDFSKKSSSLKLLQTVYLFSLMMVEVLASYFVTVTSDIWNKSSLEDVKWSFVTKMAFFDVLNLHSMYAIKFWIDFLKSCIASWLITHY